LVFGFKLKLILSTILFTIMFTWEEEAVISMLRKHGDGGLTITDLVKISGLSRSTVRTILAKLDGAGKISFRKIGMAKLYSVKKRSKSVKV